MRRVGAFFALLSLPRETNLAKLYFAKNHQRSSLFEVLKIYKEVQFIIFFILIVFNFSIANADAASEAAARIEARKLELEKKKNEALEKAKNPCPSNTTPSECAEKSYDANFACSGIVSLKITPTLSGIPVAEEVSNEREIKACQSTLARSINAYYSSKCKISSSGKIKDDAFRNDCSALRISLAEVRHSADIPDFAGDDLKEKCDNIFTEEKDNINECKKLDMKQANACAKSAQDDGGIMQNDTMQMATPLLSMVSGADTLYGLYTAMNDKPACRLSKADFTAEKDKLETQKKDLEDKIKENMKDSETAQSEYATKLKEWAEQEGKIADRLEAIPAEKEDSKDKLDGEKVKTKMQADSKYNAVVDQMGEMRRKYNELVDARSVAMAKSSEFAFHDFCSEVAVGNDPTKQKPSNQPSHTVQAQFGGAFAQGKTLATNIQKRYDACMNEKRASNRQVTNSFANELSAIKAKLQSYEGVLGQINEEKRLAEQEINKQIAKLAVSADAEIKKLARDYQKIQADKSNEQALLKQKLNRLATENKKSQQQLAIMGMRLQAFAGKRPPKTTDDKSMDDMLTQCGPDFLSRFGDFKNTCCASGSYKGSGASACKTGIADFTATLPTLTKEERAAKRKADQEKATGANRTY